MVRAFQTAKKSDKAMKELPEISLNENYTIDQNSIIVTSEKTFQKHIGFGGAFTEASAITLKNASKANQDKIMTAYFDKEKGIGYNIGRTTIGGCDFAEEPYTYIDERDDELKTFDMSRDDEAIVPMIESACRYAKENIQILSSPWSPPAFMKDNNDIDHGGHLLKEYYGTWAEYMVRYLRVMMEKGFDIRAVSVQNETAAKQPWASCKYTPLEEAEFACDYLYEELKKYKLENKIKIVIVDHNRDIVFRRVKESMTYPDAEKKICGVGVHWYCCDKSENLTMLHNHFPNLHIIFTEGCVELAGHSGATSSKLAAGAWEHGETYGRHIIKDLNNYTEAWIDWNLVLNEEGGPNYRGNFCEAPIMVDRNTDEVIINASYYYIGHFSKYIKSGALRLMCENDVEWNLYSLAYKNPNGEIVIVAQNQGEEDMKIALVVDDKGADVILPAHSITTYLIA